MIEKLRRLLGMTTAVIVIALLIIAGRIIFAAQPTTHPESNSFIIHYNTGESAASLIFDPSNTDWSNFQARELSYLLDYLDARFIYFCIRSRCAHFYSLTTLLLLIFSAILIHRKLKKLYPQSNIFLQAAIPLLYVLTFVGGCSFFRSSKPAVSFLLIWLFFNIVEMLKSPEKFSTFRSQLSNLFLLLLLPGFDRIGFFIAAAVCGGSALLLMIFSCSRQFTSPEKSDLSKKPLLILSVFAISSVIVSLLYNFIIAPEIVEYYHNYRPSFEYQRFQAFSSNVFSDGALFILKNYGAAFFPVEDTAAIVLGLAVVIIILYSGYKIARRSPELRLYPAAWLGIFISSIICTGMMISRHRAMQQLPPGAYFQVFGTILLMFFAVILMEINASSIRKILLLFLIMAFITPLYRAKVPFKNQYINFALHEKSTPHTIELLNDPQKTPQELLPPTSFRLIRFSREYPFR